MSGKGISALHPKQNRGDKMVQETQHDPYHAKLKLKENTVCASCSAIYKNGRWSWGDAPENALSAKCPACQRIADKVPAGFLSISQEYLGKRNEEIMNQIRHTEKREKDSHPMKRIMDIENNDTEMLITFTDPGLARNVGDALKNAYGGTLDYTYTQGEFMLRVTLGL